MKQILFLVSLVVVLTTVVNSALAGAPAARNFSTGPMSGAQEVPSVVTRAQGTAVFNLDPTGTKLLFRVNVARISNVFASHIHSAPSGVNGPVVVGLFSGPPGGGQFNGVLATGTIIRGVTPLPVSLGPVLNDAERFDVLIGLMRSGNTYVNVHTLPGTPSGEIRGQIIPHP